jgi:polyhydroxyalkanoate synthase subunit PhaC
MTRKKINQLVPLVSIPTPPPNTPIADKRFSSEAWQNNPFSQLLAQQYLIGSQWLRQQTELIATQFPAANAAQMRFMTEQMIAASAPSNYLATNPEALAVLVETNGASLQNGLANMLCDLRKGRMTQTDETAFEVGKNLAVSPGAVIFENDFFQLLQYSPSTATVYSIPLLMVPPCINKFYILDLQPETSFVKYAVEQGQTVFLVSWRNPIGLDLNHATWDDYVAQGIVTAILVVQAITQQPTINALGFCVGGTLLTTALAVLAAKGQYPVASLTLLTTLLDFSDPGVLGVFMDENQIKQREQTIAVTGKGGLMSAKELNNSFSMLRPNDLIWNYVVSQYLKGQPPPKAFDLLYWNGDSTNIPGPMFAWYLRHLYLENRLPKGTLTVLGETVNVSKLTFPCYVFSAKEDHIVPWQSAYISAKLLGDDGKSVRYVQGASGHIAGVINPAHKHKRSYKVSEPLSLKKGCLSTSPEVWEASAPEFAGSWWVDWSAWLAQYAGKKIAANTILGNEQHPVIEAAPGRYVAVRAMPL